MGALVLFATRYGSTREYAEAVAAVLGCPALDVAAEEGGGRLPDASLLVLGAPIYGPAVLPAMGSFCRLHRAPLTRTPVAAFVVCGDTVWIPRAGEGGGRNLGKLTGLFPAAPIASAVFGGRMRMEELDGRDRPAIEAFYRRLGRDATGFDRMELAAAERWAEGLRERL